MDNFNQRGSKSLVKQRPGFGFDRVTNHSQSMNNLKATPGTLLHKKMDTDRAT